MINYISTQPGTGKTHYMISEVIKTYKDVKHLIVQPTMKLQEETNEVLSLIGEHVKLLNTDSKNENLIQDIRTALRDDSVRVLLITERMFYLLAPSELKKHKTWMDDCIEFSKNYFTGIALNDYDNWSTIFNETVFQFISVHNAHFDNVVLNEATPEMSDEVVHIITKLKSLMRGFNKLAVNNDYANNPPKEDQKRFITLVGWHDLSDYCSLDICYMANDFDSSLLYQYNQSYFVKVNFTGKANIDTNRLDVRYFVPSTSLKFGLTKGYTEDVEGKNLLNNMVAYINSNESKLYYTENTNITLDVGEKYSPNLRGINTLQHMNTCAWFSCMNGTTPEINTYKKLFGFTSNQIKTEREYSVLFQFICRGGIRRRDSTEKMVVYVVSEDQARFISNNPTYIDLNITHKKATKPGPIPKLTEEQQLAWNAYKTQFKRLMKKNEKMSTNVQPEKVEDFINRIKLNEELSNYINVQFEKFLTKLNNKK